MGAIASTASAVATGPVSPSPPQAIIAQEIANNRFTIRTDKPNVKVSWQVTGIRHDAYAEARRIPVEEDKPEQFRGLYLFPEGFMLTVESASAEERQAQLQAKSIGAAMGAKVEPLPEVSTE